jgi:hypothetical protein
MSLVLVAVLVLGAPLSLAGCGLGAARDPSSSVMQPGDYPPVTKTPQPTGDAYNKAEEVQIFKNSNPDAVHGGATKPVTFTLDRPTTISYIQTYHWDSGKPPGKISIKGADGTVYGPWSAAGVEGQGGMPNAYWEVRPMQSLAPGTYTVVDSDPGSWSTNDRMGGAGQTIVQGYPE